MPGSDAIGDQALAGRAVVADDDGRLGHGGVPTQCRLDFAGLDTEASDLDLLIGPSLELEHPVGSPPRQVPGTVHPGAGLVPMRVGHEVARRSNQCVQVAPRQAGARHVQLARCPHGNRLETGVEHVEAVVRQWNADWNGTEQHGVGDAI